MLQCLTLVLLTAIPYTTSQKLSLDPVMVFANNTWILAAAGTTGVEPPEIHCVHITVTESQGKSDCVYVALNNTVTHHQNYRIVGINEINVTRIRTVGPVLPYTDNEKKLNYSMGQTYYSTACWNPLDHRLRDYRYIVHYQNLVKPNDNHLILVGVNTRAPHPEIQIALLTKTKENKHIVQKMVNEYNNGIRHFYEYDEFLPALHIKCAIDYSEIDPKDPINVDNWKTKTPLPPKTEITKQAKKSYKSSFEC